jgi:hypothetical protein
VLWIRIRKDSETFGRIRIRSGTKINVSDPDSQPDSNVLKCGLDYQQLLSRINYYFYRSHFPDNVMVLIVASMEKTGEGGQPIRPKHLREAVRNSRVLTKNPSSRVDKKVRCL